MADDRLLTYRDLADWLSLPMGTLNWWVATDKIPYIRLGPRTVRFVRADIERFLRERSQGLTHANADPP